MMAVVGKPEMNSMRRVPILGARAVGLDYAHGELFNGGCLSDEEYTDIRKVIDDLLSPDNVTKLYLTKEQVEAQEKEEKQSTTPTSDAAPLETPPQLLDDTKPKVTPDDSTTTYIDCVALRNSIKIKTDKMKFNRNSQQRDAVKHVNREIHTEANSYATQGMRKHMEDQYFILTQPNLLFNMLDAPHQAYYGIYDGHSGKLAAEYARIHLHSNIFDELSSNQWTEANVMSALHRGYLRTNEEFNIIANKNSINAGTTAASVIIWPNKIFIANVGDSEVVICRDGTATLLTYSHLPDKKEEKERIMNLGGIVVAYGTWRVNGLLSVSRSIGDNGLDKLVIADPFVAVEDRTSSDQFLIMATDGLWDVMKYQDACDFVRKNVSENGRDGASRALVEEGIRRKTTDNITALIVFLHDERQ